MSRNTLPIVGMYYRPPAKALIAALPIGTRLYLIAEPENQYDKNAIAVYIHSSDIPVGSHATLEKTLPPFGYDLGRVLTQEAWHLGYIPKNFAAELRSSGAIEPDLPYEVAFSTSAAGEPRVRREEPFPIS